MGKFIILAFLVIITVGCSKTSGDVSKYADATEAIQEYAQKHMTADWFSVLEPVGQFEVTGVEIKKAKVLEDDDHSAELTVILQGYYTPMASTDKDETKQFTLKKKFNVTRVTYGKEAKYSVKLMRNNN